MGRVDPPSTEDDDEHRDGDGLEERDGAGPASGGDLPFARDLFEAADRLRGSVESAEYKHLVLGLIFLKYISDSFEHQRARIERWTRDPANRDYFTDDDAERHDIVEDRDEYIAENVFYVPDGARWPELMSAVTRPDIGTRLDDALRLIEKENESQLRGVLPRIYARAPLAPATLGELVKTIGKVGFGMNADEARDVLGRTYEYFIKTFARHEGHRGGEFYTPAPVARLLVEMVEPYEGRVFDPACGSGGLFVQSAKFLAAHDGRQRDIRVYGQEKNQATWRIGRMNLAIHGLSGDLRYSEGGSLLDDQFQTLRADFVVTNPPFNLKSWGAARVSNDGRWHYGVPSDRNANYAWIQHFIAHLAPAGRAGFVMANGSLTSMANGEDAMREAIVRDDLLDCVVSCPPQMFYTTPIPVCLWFLDRDKARPAQRDHRQQTLFIDARGLASKVTRTQVEFSAAAIAQIAGTYHAWRGSSGRTYDDVDGFCRSASLDDIEAQGFALTPGIYVGTADVEDDDPVPFGERIQMLVSELERGLVEAREIEAELMPQLRALLDDQ